MSIAQKIIGSLGRAIQVTSDKSDIFLSVPELVSWTEMYNQKMDARNLPQNKVPLFNPDGSIDGSKFKEAFEAYNAVYLYNLEREVELRNKNTGISLYNPYNLGLKIPTKIRSADRAGLHGRGIDESDLNFVGAKNITKDLSKTVVPGFGED